MDQDIVKRFLEKKPFEEEYGLAGPSPRRERMRELLGSTGGDGSYQVDAPKISPAPVVQGQEGGGASGGTKRVIITDSGVANYYDIVATYVGPV